MLEHSEISTIRPEFIRLPRAGKSCPHTSLSRTALNALILPTPSNGFLPPVKSIVVRHRGNQRGIRLISYDSLLAYLHGCDSLCAKARKVS